MCICTCAPIHKYRYTYIYIHTYTYVYIYIYTYTHTYVGPCHRPSLPLNQYGKRGNRLSRVPVCYVYVSFGSPGSIKKDPRGCAWSCRSTLPTRRRHLQKRALPIPKRISEAFPMALRAVLKGLQKVHLRWLPCWWWFPHGPLLWTPS